jgi:hypothetical protein
LKQIASIFFIINVLKVSYYYFASGVVADENTVAEVTIAVVVVVAVDANFGDAAVVVVESYEHAFGLVG